MPDIVLSTLVSFPPLAAELPRGPSAPGAATKHHSLGRWPYMAPDTWPARASDADEQARGGRAGPTGTSRPDGDGQAGGGQAGPTGMSRPDVDEQARRGRAGLTGTSRPDTDRSAVSAEGRPQRRSPEPATHPPCGGGRAFSVQQRNQEVVTLLLSSASSSDY